MADNTETEWCEQAGAPKDQCVSCQQQMRVRNDTTGMQRYEHRNKVLFIDEDEHVYDDHGVLIGYVCNRGAVYGVGVLDDEYNEIAKESGVAEYDDEELDVLLALYYATYPQ